MTHSILYYVELASETPTVDSNLEFSVVIYFEMFKDISSSDKLPRPSMSRHREVGIWRKFICVELASETPTVDPNLEFSVVNKVRVVGGKSCIPSGKC